MQRLKRFALVVLLLLAGCSGRDASIYPLSLAEFTQSKVSVAIRLERDPDGGVTLAATFTPEAGLHLYSMDIPRAGVEGLGRPTLLELPPGSRLQPAGELAASLEALPVDELQPLPVYPEGPVTMRLPVQLPQGSGWYDEQVSVTYMACTDGQCCPPVVDLRVVVRIPGAEIP